MTSIAALGTWGTIESLPAHAAVTTTTSAVLAPRDVSAFAGGSFSPGMPAGAAFFSATNYWRTRATGTKLAPNSAAMVSNLAGQVAALYSGIAAFNAYDYSVSFYTVSADVPRVDVLWDDCQSKGYVPDGLKAQFAGVPFPAELAPAAGTDGELTIYSPSSNQIWEFWQARHDSAGWHACWGGRMDRVSTTKAAWFANGFGASSTSLADFAGAVTLADVKAGSINHVLALAVPKVAPWNQLSWPAQRGDGAMSDAAPDAIPEGTRFRLNPSVNVDLLHLSPLATMVARAAQKYGFIVTDRAGCVSVIAENGAGIQAASGVDPWAAYLTKIPTYLVMRNFPWRSLQAMPRNYGKPARRLSAHQLAVLHAKAVAHALALALASHH